MPPEIELEKLHCLSLNINLDGKRVGFIDAWEDKNVEKGVWVEYVYLLEKHRDSGIGTTAREDGPLEVARDGLRECLSR